MSYSIALDIGTTNVKCVLFGGNAVALAEAQKEYETHFPRPSWAEQNPDDWWNGAIETIRAVLAKSRIDPREIKVLSVSSQAPTLLPVDRDGNPLHNALIWMDRRSTEEMGMIKQTVGDQRVFDITGNRLDTYFILTELAWFARKHPDLLDKTYKIIQVNGYINYKLTGVFSIDYTHKSLTQLYDLHNKCWSRELFDAIGVDPEIMPDTYGCSEPIGVISREAAALTGLSQNTVVLGGSVDTVATLEAAVHSEGAIEMTGTSSVLVIGCDHLVSDSRVSHINGVDHRSELLFCAMSTAGASLKWFRDTYYDTPELRQGAYARINEEIEKDAPDPSKMIFLPYMIGERSPIWNPDARGTFVGLSLSTSRAQLARSIMEGVCFALRDNMEIIQGIGVPIDTFFSAGGCTKSDIWLRIKASVLQREIVLPATNLGAPGGLAYLMSAYLGEFSSPEEAAKTCLRIDRRIEPVNEWCKVYDDMYHSFKSVYRSLEKDFTTIADISR